MRIKPLLTAAAVASTLIISQSAFSADSVATVNGKPIKQSWVDYIMKDAAARGQKPSDGMKNAIINELVGSELAYQEAQKQGIDKLPDYKTNEELTQRKLLVNIFLADFMKKNPVTEADKKEAYEQYKKELGDKEFNARHILVKTESEANDILAQVKKGSDFAKLAKESLKKGEITQAPVQTQFGWHVIKMVDSRATQVPTYDKVKEGLERTLQQRKLEKMMLDLKAKAKIDVTGATTSK